MIHNSARFLPRSHLERLLRGLRQRTQAGAQESARRLEELRSELQRIEQEAADNEQILHSRHQQQIVATITAWDEQRQEAWDAAERRAFHAVTSTSSEERQVRADAKRQGDEATAEAKRRVADIEKRFLRSKDKTVAKLTKLKRRIERLAGELGIVEHETVTLLAQRGINPEPFSTSLPENLPASSLAAMAACQEQIALSRQLLQKLGENRLSRSIESVRFWLVCAAIGAVVAAALGGLGVLPWLIAALAGVIVAVFLGLAALVAVHPWIRRMVKAEYPQLHAALTLAWQYQRAAAHLATLENDAALRRIAQKRDQRFAEAAQWRENVLKELSTQLKQQMLRLRSHAALERMAVKEQLTRSLAEVDAQGHQQQHSDAQSQAASLAQQQAEVQAERQRIASLIERTRTSSTLRIHAASQRAVEWLQRGRRWNQTHFPRWEQLAGEHDWPQLPRPILPLGTVRAESLLPESVVLDAGNSVLAPVNFEPLRDRYLTITVDPSLPASQNLIRSLILRALTTLPPGKTQVAVIDPPGLGRDYGWLMHLGDYDPELVTHRVWTQAPHIAKHLTHLALKAEDFIQQSLRNQYATIEQYNRDAGPLAEPYRLLVWTAFPLGLDDQSWKPLQSLLDSGARCGIIPIFLIDPAQPWEQPERRELLMRRGLHVRWEGAPPQLHADAPGIEPLAIEPAEAPDEATAQAVVHEIGRRAMLASRVEVPLVGIAPPRDQWWQADSSPSLEIPIGQSGVGRVQSLKLGTGTAQHAIVAGKTGSGKSTLLHAIIASAAAKYSPDRLRLVLLDFKKGVEFQAYSQAELPHADIIGIESQREFGLSALEYVDRCIQLRGQMFRDAGVQDLQSWNLVRPDRQMPRMLIVIDEFQELFVEDDKLTSQVSLILDRIVRQGRSFGVHAILSSQTLAGAYSLPRTTMGQMAVRIALQCDAADAQIIFADDNPAASRLNHPGQAIYNDQGGRVEGNHPMQIGWLTKSELIEWLGALPGRGYHNADSSTNLLGRTVVFDGNRAATFDPEAAARAIETARSQLNPDACWCVVGESVAISPAVTLPLTDQAGRNAMIVGGDDAPMASVLLAIARSFAEHYAAAKRSPQLAVIQAARPTDALCLAVPERLRELPAQVEVADARSAEGLLAQLHATLKSRVDAADTHAQWQPILLSIINIGRLRSLRPEDEFGLGSFGEAKLTPDKQLEELLRDGPSHLIHVVITAENANTIGRWLGRAALREIEIRLLMQMGANDSTHLIDSVAAAHLGSHVMLLHDDATSTQARFRPYEFQSLTAPRSQGAPAANVSATPAQPPAISPIGQNLRE